MSPVVPHFELVEERSAGGVDIVNVSGEIHLTTAPRFRERLEQIIAAGDGTLVLDLTAVAVGRTIIALLENGQREDGSVAIPAALVPFGAPAELPPAS